jgi:branched-chain amino acid transport system ATP-binding protein
MLQIDQLQAFYDKRCVLHGVQLEVRQGEILVLLGRNGAGRSTLAKAIMGLVSASGSITWRGQPLLGLQPFEVARAGIGYVPESKDIFPQLSVAQNLLLGHKGTGAEAQAMTDSMYRRFPQLKAREHVPAGVLSGGEQQMLALCRTLMGQPELIILDEPTEGLAPQTAALVAQQLLQLKQQGLSVLLIEQKLELALNLADRCAVMGHGRIVFTGSAEELRRNEEIRRQWLEV